MITSGMSRVCIAFLALRESEGEDIIATVALLALRTLTILALRTLDIF